MSREAMAITSLDMIDSVNDHYHEQANHILLIR